MKKALLLVFGFLTFFANAQFPSPQDFQFSYVYYNCNQSGYCNGVMVNGPTYCSDFWWSAPDSLRTSSHLDHYKVYYLDYFNMDTSVIATTEDLQVEMLIGIIGKIWVTAVYSDPDGESPPSNSVENTDLPIGIDENQSSEGISFFYDPAGQSLHFSDPEQLSHINIINLQGITVKNSKHLSSDYSLTDLTPGCYFVKVYKNDGSYLLKKIIR